MPISFDSVPSNLRVPGTYIEFSNRLGGNSQIEFKLVVLGQRLAAGTVAEGVPVRVYNADDAEKFFGRGSQLHLMFIALKKADPYFETWAIAMDDGVGSTAGTKTLTVTGAATEAGAATIYMGGKKVVATIADTDDVTAIATAIVAAVTADTLLPFTAANTLGVVTLTAKNKGEAANDIDVRVGYNGESLPAGVAIAVADGVTGATNPDITTALAAMADEWYNWIVNPWNDATNLAALDTELDDRYGPLKQIGARTFTAYRENLANTATFGNGRNNPHVTTMGTNTSPTPPYEWAAVNAVVAGAALALDPARQVRTLELTGVLPPAIADRWDDTERNSLLFDGISTYTVTADGKVLIEQQITNYQKNDLAIADDSYLYINTPETLERIRYEQRARFGLKYPRHKLASDDARPAPGQPVMQPKLARAELLALYRDFEAKGWAQDYDGYAETLLLEVDNANSERLNWYDSPKLVGNLRVTAGHTEFRK